MIAGQSNAVGTDTYDGVGLHPTGTYEWRQGGGYAVSRSQLDHPGFKLGDMGLDITFAEQYLLANPTATIVFIPCADGGTSFTANDWNVGDPLYNAAVSRANAAIAFFGVPLSGILWHQGESDTAMTQAAYETALQGMVNGMRSEITNAASVPLVVGELGSFFAGGANVNAALNNVRSLLANSAVSLNTSLTDTGDNTHFNAASLRTMGERYHTEWSTTAQS